MSRCSEPSIGRSRLLPPASCLDASCLLMNPNAKAFVFNPGASSFTPPSSSTPPPINPSASAFAPAAPVVGKERVGEKNRERAEEEEGRLRRDETKCIWQLTPGYSGNLPPLHQQPPQHYQVRFNLKQISKEHRLIHIHISYIQDRPQRYGYRSSCGYPAPVHPGQQHHYGAPPPSYHDHKQAIYYHCIQQAITPKPRLGDGKDYGAAQQATGHKPRFGDSSDYGEDMYGTN